MISYHDVTVIVDGIKYKISDNYAYQLMCTRVGGWELFYKWGGVERLIGGEFNGGEFIIKVHDVVICSNTNKQR